MSKIYQNLFVLLAIPPLITYADLSGVKCVDCKNVTGDDCEIRSTGYECYPTEKEVANIGMHNNTYFDDDPPETDDMDVCIPGSVTIDQVINYCCVWSPKLGCQLLRGRRVPKTALECVRCTIQDLNTEMEPVCPCVDSAPRRRVSALPLVAGVLLVLERYIIACF